MTERRMLKHKEGQAIALFGNRQVAVFPGETEEDGIRIEFNCPYEEGMENTSVIAKVNDSCVTVIALSIEATIALCLLLGDLLKSEYESKK